MIYRNSYLKRLFNFAKFIEEWDNNICLFTAQNSTLLCEEGSTVEIYRIVLIGYVLPIYRFNNFQAIDRVFLVFHCSLHAMQKLCMTLINYL